MLDVTHRRVVIIGGGAVAARKARRLLQAGATQVRVVAPAFDPAMPQDVERVVAPYDPSYLDGADLVFAATDSAEVNAAVVRDARVCGVWVNRVDGEQEPAGDFTVPSSLEDGRLIIAVASGSPALSRRICRQMLEQIDPQLGAFATALTQLRSMVRNDENLSAAQRREILLWLSQDVAIETFRRRGVEGLISEAQAVCPAWKPKPLS